MTSNILVIPDPHATPGTDQSRFSWFGKLATVKQPDVIVCLGDFAEIGSLSLYDVGKVSAEGKRYQTDIECCHEALQLFQNEIDTHNYLQRERKKKQYSPVKHMVIGNHETRIERARAENPRFYDTISIDDLKFKEYGWNVWPMTSGVVVEDIVFAHYFTSGVMSRAIGGANHARNLILKNHVSSVCGHSHLLDYSVDTNALGKPLFGLVCGCAFDFDMDWTSENARYGRGVVYLHDCKDGWAYPEFLGMEKLKEKYSSG